MNLGTAKIRLIALFLVTFAGLNAGGTLCVAYCRTTVEAVMDSQDHCPLKKKQARVSHCDPKPGEPQDLLATVIGSDRLDCCGMTLSFIGAPIEKRFTSFQTDGSSVPAKIQFEPALAYQNRGQTAWPVYRGPPPLDRRIERIKHHVIRI